MFVIRVRGEGAEIPIRETPVGHTVDWGEGTRGMPKMGKSPWFLRTFPRILEGSEVSYWEARGS